MSLKQEDFHQEQKRQILQHYRLKIIRDLDTMTHFLNNKERTHEENISLQHLLFLKRMYDSRRIEYENPNNPIEEETSSNNSNQPKSSVRNSQVLNKQRETLLYSNTNKNKDWLVNKKLNPNFKKNWCKHGKRCRNPICHFRHAEDVGLADIPPIHKWCENCKGSKGECTCIHLFVN